MSRSAPPTRSGNQLCGHHDACADGRGRADRRDRAHALLNRQPVLDALGHNSIDDYLQAFERDRAVATQTKFDLPVLPVATDNGYKPPLSEIIQWVIDQTHS